MKVMNPRLVRAARRIDFVWRPLSWVFARGKAPVGSPRSILVLDLHLVGDIVMLLPLLRALRERHPAARITLVAGPWAESILAGSDFSVELVTFEAPWVKRQRLRPAVFGLAQLLGRLRSTPWDVGIDVRGDVRQILMLCLARCRRRVGFDFTGGGSLLTDVVQDDGAYRHILDHHERLAARLGAWNGRPFVPRITLSAIESREAAGIAPFVGFHFGASLPLRRLPPADAARLLSMHEFTGDRLLVFAPPDLDDYLVEVRHHLSPSFLETLEFWRGSLRAFIVQSSRAKRMYVMDSGPAHIAAALEREVVAFFGPNLPDYTGPRGGRLRIVENVDVPCRPCDQHHCINPTYQACMLGLVNAVDRTPKVAGDASSR